MENLLVGEWKLGPFYNGRHDVYESTTGRTVCHAFSSELAKHIIKVHNDAIQTQSQTLQRLSFLQH